MLEEEALGGAGSKGEVLASFFLHLFDDMAEESFRRAARSRRLERETTKG